MYTVALTGGIGCGKSEATFAFAELGVPIVDLDIISHQLTAAKQPLVQVITAHFGQDYMTENGALNRVKMRQLVFNDEKALGALNAILHPAIYQAAVKQLASYKITDTPYAILAIPLLDKESPYHSVIDRILVIDCDEATQIERVRQRSQLDTIEVKKIIKAQTPRQTRRAMADDLIENNGNIETLRQKVGDYHRKYIKTCIVNKIIS